MNRGASWSWSGLAGLGMLAVFVGERVIGVGTGRTAATAAGLILVLASLAVRLVRWRRATGDGRRVERALLELLGLGVLALACYFAQSDLSASVIGKPLERDFPKLAGALAALWPALWLLAALPTLLVEFAYASMARAPAVEWGRVRDAMLSGFGLGFALVFAFALAYVADARDKKLDLSYFRTSRPSEATRKLVRALDQPVQVAYFFPSSNEVREEVASYLDELAKESPKIEVTGYDQAVDPAKAKELGVSGNGIVVVARQARHEQLSLGLELEGARSQLRTFDKELQKRLLQVAKPGRTVYLTTGHAERTADPTGDTDKRGTVRALRQLLNDQSYTVRDLGAAEGLATDVPADATAVLIIGPTHALLPEEAASLGRYFDKGGHLFIALDPEAGLDMKDLLAPLGVAFSPTVLANDALFARRFYQASDRANLVTGSYSSHPSVGTLGRLRPPVVLPGAGALTESKDPNRPKGLVVDMTVHAQAGTWNDLDGNFQFDPPKEVKKAYDLAAAITKTTIDGKIQSRAIVLGDSDALTDAVIGNYGNPYLLLDGLKWLLGEEALAGETSSEADVAIAHTRGQDARWFYSTIFVAPALALGLGSLATRRRRRSRRGESAPAGKEVAA